MEIIDSKNKFFNLYNNNYRFYWLKEEISENKNLKITDDSNIYIDIIKTLLEVISIFFLVMFSFILVLAFLKEDYISFFIFPKYIHFFTILAFLALFVLYLKELKKINNYSESFNDCINKINFENNINKEDFYNIVELISFKNKIKYEIFLMEKDYFLKKYFKYYPNEIKLENLSDKIILLKFDNNLIWNIINYKPELLEDFSYLDKSNTNLETLITIKDLENKNIKLKYESGYSIYFKWFYFFIMIWSIILIKLN
jgi:hypothetical protein